MKVKVAAAQMSHTVAAAIETYVSTHTLPSEAIHTAEFVEKVDKLFDSLNSNEQYPRDGKQFRCALSENSPHLEMWYSILREIGSWQIIDLKTGRNKTNMFSFMKGWQITLQSIIFLWKTLKVVGFKYLNLKVFNQDALENFFCCIRQHGIANTNPTCFQFVQALKTCVVNHMTLPFKAMSVSNCENDDYTPLSSLCHFLAASGSSEHLSECEMNGTDTPEQIYSYSDGIIESVEDQQSLAYVAGYVLKAIDVPDDCETCNTSLDTSVVTENHLKYASERVMIFLRALHDQLYEYLNSHGHTTRLHDNLKKHLFCLIQQFVINMTLKRDF
ncbi:uncharacterized protein LOC126198910 [Schistocerca nitens]|uniref:uncharacterized protein LOC126198910 n=1 Tax=Schistocerca nitens TaxID=7011 RepID=UPI0021176E4D|nr:uncharacterized protein LOC126198910 [Schistocerca nitens]